MDLLEQPDIKEAYDKYKLTVKIWEHKFIKKHKRVPSKLDIKEAPKEVREAYKLYFQLKSAALEESFRDVEGFEDDDEQGPSNKTCADKGESNLPPKAVTSPPPKAVTSPPPNIVTSHPTPETEDTVNMSKHTEISKDIEVPKSVWGPHLNHKKNTQKVEEKQPKSNLKAKITKKLFCGSKFSKRNPRKSLSFSHRNKSDSMSFDASSLSQPTGSVMNESETDSLSQYELFFKNETFSIATDESRSVSHPVNLIQSMIDNNIDKSTKNIDVGWLQRVAEVSGVLVEVPPSDHLQHSESTKLDYDSEDIIEESDEEIMEKPLHIAKKRKLDETTNNKLYTNVSNVSKEQQFNLKKSTTQTPFNSAETLKSVESQLEQQSNISNNDINDTTKSFTTLDTFDLKDITNKKIMAKNLQKHKINTIQAPKTSKKPKKKIPPKKPLQSIEDDIDITNNLTPRRSSRPTKVKVNLREFSSDEEKDPFHSDTDDFPEYQIDKEEMVDSNDSVTINRKSKKDVGKKRKSPKAKDHQGNEYQIDNEETVDSGNSATTNKKTKKNLGKKRKSPKAKGDKGNEEEIADKPFELEFSVKPRLVTPRYTSIKNALKEKKSVNKKQSQGTEGDKILLDPKTQSAKDALQKKIASGKLNDNFVRVDIKKKVFVRGKRMQSFTQLKKQQWRNKKAKSLCGPDMDMRGCDGGTLTCFSCGRTGHFARNCTVKEDKLLPLDVEEEEEECHFPTLEEASKMARENPLKIRTPKINFEGERVNKATDEDSDCFDDEFDAELLREVLKLEEEVKKLDVQMYMDSIHSVKPYYELNEDGSIKDTPPEVYDALRNFGHESFRPGQEQAVMRILSGKSTLVTLSTGSGKSLCYQLPAFMYSKRERCISLVISPLVSLMDDQVTNIAKFMKAACLHSNQTKIQRQKILDTISGGELSVLLVSPEAVVAGERQTGFGSFLRKLPPIAFACIDEVHCVSQWSHNFRPSYLLICRVLRESLGVKTILGLTATATRTTRDSIIKHLGIPDGENGVISDIPLPDNLVLTISKDKERDSALFKLLNSERFKNCKSIVIYCTRRDECERIASFLRTGLKTEQSIEPVGAKRKRFSLVAEPYHAGLPAYRRRTIQKAFMCGDLRIVVATIAFGMGINKSDIRAVIHFNMPSSFESYVQEVGRAGRDGLEANCHVFLDPLDRDERELRRHIHANSMERHVVRKLLEKVFIPCSCTGVCLKHEVGFSIEDTVQALDIPEENISTLLCYLELHPNKYVELLSPAYTQCKVISYGGPMKIRRAAKECPPLAMALALYKPEDNQNIFEFPVIEVASAMGWESGICKHKLKNLEWITGDNGSKRSQLSVQFSNLGFRLFAPGNLSGDQLDEALDNLYNRVVEQENTALCQLNGIHSTLLELAKPSFTDFSKEDCDILKKRIREYFDASNPFIYQEIRPKPVEEESIIGDIHSLISMYRDNNFTGRAIARIFHGIQSPNYPAVIWGRCRFWRSHLDKDFHSIVKIAAKEIIKMR